MLGQPAALSAKQTRVYLSGGHPQAAQGFTLITMQSIGRKGGTVMRVIMQAGLLPIARQECASMSMPLRHAAPRAIAIDSLATR